MIRTMYVYFGELFGSGFELRDFLRWVFKFICFNIELPVDSDEAWDPSLPDVWDPWVGSFWIASPTSGAVLRVVFFERRGLRPSSDPMMTISLQTKDDF